MYYVYLLKNQAEEEVYIGYSEDLKRRLSEHKAKNPELIYYRSLQIRKRRQRARDEFEATRTNKTKIEREAQE